jgi:hypothetical protein
LPSWFKSAAAIARGLEESVALPELKETCAVEDVTCKKATFDVPPPGEGLTTVTEAVVAAEISLAKMSVFS